jgi:hypothetical protein
MIKYLMEDPIENKRKIHEHIHACRQVADKRYDNAALYLCHFMILSNTILFNTILFKTVLFCLF